MSKSLARDLRSNMTIAERKLWRALRSRQLGNAKFRRQAPIGPYIVDFVCFGRRLIVEVDGGQHAAQLREDADRTAFLNAEGFRVVRFWNNEVLENIDGVLDRLAQVLNQ